MGTVMDKSTKEVICVHCATKFVIAVSDIRITNYCWSCR